MVWVNLLLLHYLLFLISSLQQPVSQFMIHVTPQVSLSSSTFSSNVDLSSPPDTSDEHSATLVADSPAATSSTLTLATTPLPESPTLPNSPSLPNISVSDASSYLSLDTASSPYEYSQDSGPSSPNSYITAPTSNLSSPYISPQYSFHSCCSSLSPSPTNPGSSLSLQQGSYQMTSPPPPLVPTSDSSPLRRVSSYPTKRRRSPPSNGQLSPPSLALR